MKKMIMLMMMTMSLRLCEMTMLIAIESQGWGWMLSWSPMAASPQHQWDADALCARLRPGTTCTYYYKIKATTPHVLTIITALQFSYKPEPTMAFLSVFHSFPGFCWSRFCSCCLVLNLEPKYRFKRWFWINTNSNSVSNISQGWHCLTSD